MKIVVLFDFIGPYHVARLKSANTRMEVHVIEIRRKSREYGWARPAHVGLRLHTLDTGPDESATQRIQETLSSLRPDVVAIPGWSDPSALAALLWSIRTRTPRVVMSASTFNDAPRTWMTEHLKSMIVCCFSAALCGGSAQAAYLARLGLPDNRVYVGYDVVDNAHFAKGAANAAETRGIRAQLGLPSQYILSSCRFIPKKNLWRLLAAFAVYRERAGDVAWDLVLLGDGPLGPMLCAEVGRLGLWGHVHLPGFRQYEELPAYYGLAEAFVHASTVEQWGLVVNEAMAAGLPVIVSNRCGCVRDLVQDGVNGFMFDPNDVDALATQMYRMAHGNINRSAMGAASQHIIAEWGPERCATGLEAAARKALRVDRCDPGWTRRLLLTGLAAR